MKELTQTGSRSSMRRLNWPLLLTVMVVGGIGLVNLSSAAHEAYGNLAMVQGIWFGGCLLVALVLTFLDYRLFERLAYPLFVLALLSLLAVLGFGRVINNSKRWIDLGLFNFQPSEMMKIGVILALAKYFSDDDGVTRHRSVIARLIVWAHPVYPLCSAAALFWFWGRNPVIELDNWRWVLLAGCVLWEALAVYEVVSRGRFPGRKNDSLAAGQAGYTLDDLIKPSTPLYPLGAIGALIVFWERSVLAELGWVRFAMVAGCLIWAAAGTIFVFQSGRARLHDLLSPVIMVVLPGILIMRQPDLGTSLVLFATAASMILFMKVRLRSFLIAAAVILVATIASWYLLLKPYQQNRIKAFIAPSADTRDSGYHARQSIIAVGSGRLTGKGFGNSTQKRARFLPELRTDFVFAVWAEEWGFAGCLVVLLLFLFFLVLVVDVASNARDRFGALICVGLAALVFWHVFINIGMVSGVLPVVGLTLPLWSYGGSSTMAFMVGFGLVLSVSYHKGLY